MFGPYRKFFIQYGTGTISRDKEKT